MCFTSYLHGNLYDNICLMLLTANDVTKKVILEYVCLEKKCGMDDREDLHLCIN